MRCGLGTNSRVDGFYQASNLVQNVETVLRKTFENLTFWPFPAAQIINGDTSKIYPFSGNFCKIQM